MKPQLEKIYSNTSSSIAVKREITPYMDYPWHYHPEHEIIFVEKSYGIRFMGNHIENFTDGDLMFIGSNLPHVWKNDAAFYQDNKDLFVDVYVIHFREDALREGFFDLMEFNHIKKLFNLGQQGVRIRNGKEHAQISSLIKQVYAASGFERLMLFLKTLDTMANAVDYDLLSSPGYVNSISFADSERLEVITNHIIKNYATEIDIDELAELASLTKSSFCRFFKSRTRKTYSQFLNEIRILNACKMLVNTNQTITEICYETGYNNISHFNRQFKLITGMTAKDYAKKYLTVRKP